MVSINRLESLKKRHAVLEDQIEEELSRTSPDEGLVQQLKRTKLFLKDEIATHLSGTQAVA